MMIQNELLNDAEIFMKEKEPETFLRYIVEKAKITIKVGDLLSLWKKGGFWHSYNGRYKVVPENPSYLKISKKIDDECFECFDPFYDYKFAAFSEYYEDMEFETELTIDDFNDVENDFWEIDFSKTPMLGVYMFPINKRREILNFIHQRKQESEVKNDV